MNSSDIDKRTLSPQRSHPVSLMLLSVGGGLLLPIASASAQIIPEEGSTTNTVVDVVGDRIDISGGQHSVDNANLFQSFEQFDVGVGQTANFVTSPEVTNVIGRVNGGQASVIEGALQVSGSDANLYLMNPAGVLMGPEAQLNLSGGFTATTATGIGFEKGEFDTTTNGDYSRLTGDPTTFQFETMQPGAVVNLGELSVTEGESINLIGGTVVNTGELNAPGGNVTIAAVEGESTVRISQTDQLLSLEVEAQSAAPTDHISITASSIGEMLTGGELSNANTLITNADGSVQLGHTDTGIVETGGSAATAGEISTTGEEGGNINILGNQVSLAGATLDASGTTGGGLIRVGGDYQGNGPVFNAERTNVDASSTLLVNALSQGDGGRAIVWADDTTRFHGQIMGAGGVQSGNGGFAEVSGKAHLTFTGLVDLSAPQGNMGELLLDPINIFITNDGPTQTIGNDDYIPSTVLENQNANINLVAVNDIVIEDLLDNELTLRSGGEARFIADSNGIGGGEFIMRDLADTIRGERKQITISGDGITVGRIDTHTNEHNTGGAATAEIGHVTLTSSQGVSAESIHTYGFLTSEEHHSWPGGNVTVTAANGDINITREISTFSSVATPDSPPKGREAGSAGNIILRADNGSIRVSTGFPTTNSVLLASSEAVEDESGQGGAIDLFAQNGEIEIAGNIAAWSQAGSSLIDDDDGEAGDSGTVTLYADGDITIRDVLAYSNARSGDDSGTGGNVTITSVDGNFSGGSVEASSQATGDNAGDGGRVIIQANSIQMNSINTSSLVNGTDASDAGNVSLRGETQISVGSILATSTDEESADISLIGDDIELTGGDNSVEGRQVNFSSFTTNRNISVGADGGTNTLNLSTEDLNAVSNNNNSITIENAGGTGGGILTLDQSVVDSAGSRPTITINNVGKLLGPTPTNSSRETTFLLEGPARGQLEGTDINFTEVRNIEGGNGNDIFKPEASVLLTDFDSLEGGGGFNTISYEAFAGSPLTINLDSLAIGNIQRIIASTTDNNTLLGSNTDNIWTIDGNIGINSGTLNGTTFENFASLIGGSAADTFQFVNGGSITGTLSGSGGSNTLDYDLYGSSMSIALSGTATGIANGFSNIERVVGSNRPSDQLIATAGDDIVQLGDTSVVNGLAFSDIEILDGGGGHNTLIGENSNSIWTIDQTGGNTVDGVAFSNFDDLVGGAGNDTFRLIGDGVLIGTLNGGDGRDRIDYSSYSDASPVEIDLVLRTATGLSGTHSSIESAIGSANGNDVIKGTNRDEVFRANGSGSGRIQDLLNLSTFDFSAIEVLDGQGGNNDLEGLLGAETWVINGLNSGLLNGEVFERFSNIKGSVGNNVFNFEGMGAIAGTLTGNSGTDELNYSNYNRAVEVNFSTMTSDGMLGFTEIDRVVGTRFGSDRIIGTAADDTFEINGDRTAARNNLLNNTIEFSEVEILNGGAGNNSFTLNGFDASPTAANNLTIEGGSDLANGQSSNLLATNSIATTWQITGKNAGTLLGENGSAIATFNEIQQIENTSTTGATHTVRFGLANSQLTGGINGGSQDLRLVGDDINIGRSDGAGDNTGGRIAGSGRLSIRPNSDSAKIIVGGVDTQGPTELNLTTGEIAAIQDGFIEISIGDETHTGGISLGGDATFEDSVKLRSQGDIDTRSGELRVINGSLSLETEGSIASDRLVSQLRNVTLNADEDITVGSIIANGGSGIRVTSNNGSIIANDTLSTSDGILGNDVLLSANTDVRVSDIVTSGSERGGNVTIRAAQGGITTGGITTANNIVVNGAAQEKTGSVSLESPGSIEIEFIDARGNGLNANASEINISTEETFRATGTINQPELSNPLTGENLSGGASISTVGANGGNVRIAYGRSDLDAMRFVVGGTGPNGAALRIETPQTAILDGEFVGSYTQENIALLNRGIAPPVAAIQRVNRINFVGADILPASIDLVFIENTESDNIFQVIESRNGQAFSEQLGIEATPVLSRQIAQEALQDIEAATDTIPAVVYAYFVPDASSSLAVSDGQNDDSAHPDDQLEIMLLTGHGEPIRRRRWGVTRAQVEEANQQLRQQATSQFSRAQQYLAPAQQLYDWIVRPIENTLEQQNINSLGFVMDSSLRTMPIATLHDGDAFLLENYSLGILPSFSLANIHSTVGTNRIDYSQERVLAMGASEFANQPSLPAVSAELELISQGLGEGDAFLNEDFVLETLQAQLKKEDYGIVHLATHAVFEPGSIERSYIQLWDEQLSLDQLNDLHLSEEDISLIILSACSTALGDRTAEYGFAGLAVSAGSQAALASIWPVSDEGTLGFMTQFYRELGDTSVRTEALRKTQIQMLRGEVGINDGVVYGPNNETLATLPTLAASGRWDFSHPFYWSPFTMIGNPW